MTDSEWPGPKSLDVLPGDQYGRLAILREGTPRRGPGGKGRPVRVRRMFWCECSCGQTVLARLESLRRGETRSCGCLRKEVAAERGRSPEVKAKLAELRTPEHLARASTLARDYLTRHGLHGHPLYHTHLSMMQRCYNARKSSFKHYGGRGITVCPEWHDVAEFIAWIETNLGPRPEGMTLDRIDNDGNYEPGNTRWATRSQQRANQRPLVKQWKESGDD